MRSRSLRLQIERAISRRFGEWTTDLAVEFVLSPVRVLEVLLWTEVEERGHYR
jgi:hypothetical protein